MSTTSTSVEWQLAKQRPGALSGLARGLILRRLGKPQSGRLTIADPWGTNSLGDGDTELEVHVHHPRFYLDLLFGGSLGAAKAYMEGHWSASDLPAVFRFFIHNAEEADSLDHGLARLSAKSAALLHRLRANTQTGSRHNIREHYDLGNDLFGLFLDDTMTYSAGVFESDASDLRSASTAKLDRICRKLGLSPADHVVEIGGGWGSFAIHAATNYGCRVTTTTISEQQYRLARERIAAAGVSDRVELLLEDYRDLDGTYDKLVSIEMIEAVGHEFLPQYFQRCAELLHPRGQMLLQAITMPDHRYRQYLKQSDFIQRYIFPGSCCPAVSAIMGAVSEASDLKPVHLEDIAAHYARTLRLWRQRFLAAQQQVLDLGYPARFIRLWDYYLSYCEAGFTERYLGDIQLVLNKPGCRNNPMVQALPAVQL